MRKVVVSLVVLGLLLGALPVAQVSAATTQTVTVTATPTYVSISNSEGSYGFGIVAASGTPNTTSGWSTVTNDGTVACDITIECDGWSGGSSWTYGAAGADTGQLKASGTNGGVGGTGGAGLYDITLLNGSGTLFIDDLAASGTSDWEMQLDAPTSFSYGDQQTTTVTLTASAS
jgi:hypothetical protein